MRAMTKPIGTERDENGYEVDPTYDPKTDPELKRIQETGERLNFRSAGATRKQRTPR